MTINAFMHNYGIKKKETVIKWILDDLIPGSNLGADYVPDSARPPYTRARAQNTQSIYHSIVVASRNRCHVLPKLYNICEDEFNSYINQLVAANLITIRETDGITYYDATPTGQNGTRKFILEALEACSRGIAEGTANAMLNQR